MQLRAGFVPSALPELCGLPRERAWAFGDGWAAALGVGGPSARADLADGKQTELLKGPQSGLRPVGAGSACSGGAGQPHREHGPCRRAWGQQAPCTSCALQKRP